jgi:hypothetical protein
MMPVRDGWSAALAARDDVLAIVEIINVERQEPAEAPEIAPLWDPPAIPAAFGLELLEIHYNLERPPVLRT